MSGGTGRASSSIEPPRRRVPAEPVTLARTPMRTCLLAVFVLIVSASAFAQPPADARVDAIFAQYNAGTPGCALGVVRDGKLTYEKGYGQASLELGVPITPRTVFDIGSTSKQITATAVVLLAQQAKLSLDD